jgi:hypothetical protein
MAENRLKRLRALEKIERFRDMVLQARAAELVDLQQERRKLDQTEEELNNRRKAGAAVTMVEAMPYVSHFVDMMRVQSQRIEVARRQVDRDIDIKREEVREAWSEHRSTEGLMARLAEQRKRLLGEAEQRESDERSIVKHSRKLLGSGQG